MNLLQLLTVIDSGITLDIDNVREKYESKEKIPDDRMNYVVRLVKPDNNDILIILDEPKKYKSLEELGYSFEAGM
jgi:hypothetical protein